ELCVCSELEFARLLPAVEMVASLFAAGALHSDPGPAAPLLVSLWHQRNQRFSSHERQAFFGRLFGATQGPAPASPEGRNSDFFSLMVQLTDALAKIGSDPIAAVLPTSQDLLRTPAEALAENLLPRTRGITLFAAQELVRDTREALAVFEQRSIQQALGESTVWGAVRGVSRLYLGEQPDVTSHLTRGKAGSIL